MRVYHIKVKKPINIIKVMVKGSAFFASLLMKKRYYIFIKTRMAQQWDFPFKFMNLCLKKRNKKAVYLRYTAPCLTII